MTMAGILAQRAFYAQTGMHVQMRLVAFVAEITESGQGKYGKRNVVAASRRRGVLL